MTGSDDAWSIRWRPFCLLGSGIEVRQAQLADQGKGLWATKTFRRGDVITFYDGQPVDKIDLFSETVGHQPGSHTLTIHGSQIAVQGLRMPFRGGGGGSFANHRPPHRANATYWCVQPTDKHVRCIHYALDPDEDIDICRMAHCVLVALQQIDPGCEITCDYGRHTCEVLNIYYDHHIYN